MSPLLLLLAGAAHAQDGAWGDLLTEQAPGPAPQPGASAPPMDVEAAPDGLGAMPASGWRISQVGGSHGVSLAETMVVGPSGGVNVTTLQARMVFDETTVSARLPFAAYRTPDGRTTDLGNLSVEGLYQLQDGDLLHAFGVEAHFNPGGRPWTWLHRATELWPGGGIAAVYQLRAPWEGGITWLARGTLGIHGARDYEPFPGVYGQLGVAGGLDWAVPTVEGLGLVGETAITYWDLSPWEVTGLVRYDPVPGLRARGGLVLPMFSWFGWTPARFDGGLDEVTLHLDVQMTL